MRKGHSVIRTWLWNYYGWEDGYYLFRRVTTVDWFWEQFTLKNRDRIGILLINFQNHNLNDKSPVFLRACGNDQNNNIISRFIINDFLKYCESSIVTITQWHRNMPEISWYIPEIFQCFQEYYMTIPLSNRHLLITKYFLGNFGSNNNYNRCVWIIELACYQSKY